MGVIKKIIQKMLNVLKGKVCLSEKIKKECIQQIGSDALDGQAALHELIEFNSKTHFKLNWIR